MKIGIVLAGGASKGPYEVGVLRALEEYFGAENFHCVSSASVGALIAQAHSMGSLDQLAKIWNNINTEKNGTFFLSYTGNNDVLTNIDNLLDTNVKPSYEHYVSVWNYTQHRVEYIPFHTLEKEELKQYMRGAIAVPFFSRGQKINGNRILDGAFLDNIPVYPLIDKDLDFIFCAYFDNRNYLFENEEFDKKIIKLFDFPNTKMLEMMYYSASGFDKMAAYGYDYTMKIIKRLFDNAETNEQVYEAIQELEKTYTCTYKPRLTADTVLNNINVVAKRYSKRLSSRTKKK